MATHSSGANKLFFWTSSTTAFTTAFAENAYSSAKIGIAGTSASSASLWGQVRKTMGGKITLTRNGEILELGNDVDGLQDIVISGPDIWELQFENVQMDIPYFQNLTNLDPTQSNNWSATGRPTGTTSAIGGKLSYEGQSLLTNGITVLIYRAAYDPGNTTNTPKLGTGSDPLAWLFFKFVLADRSLILDYDSKGQLMFSCRMRAVGIDTTSFDNIAYVNGYLTYF